ncbi:MAG: lipopolysaccharide biosynthesis protein [Syntrophobacteraceae bacterium]
MGGDSNSNMTLMERITTVAAARGLPLGSGRGTITIVDQAVASATNFVTGVIIGRACSKAELGFYMLGFTIMLFANGVQQALILSPYIVFSAQRENDRLRLYTGSSLVYQVGLCVLTTLCLAIAAAVLAFISGSERLDAILWALSAVMPLILLREFARQVSFARLQAGVALLLDCGVFAVQTGGLLLLASNGMLSASRAYWLIGAACGAVALIWLVWSRGAFAFAAAQIVPDLRQNWRLARWLFGSTVARAGSSQMYPWILTAFHGAAATGVLAACRGILFFANPFLIGLQNFLGPKFAHEFHKKGSGGLYRATVRAVLVIAALMGVFCLAMLLFGGSILTIAYGEKYAGYGVVIAVLALAQLASAVNTPLTASLMAMERTDVEFKASLAAVVVMSTIGIWLVKSLGPLGVGYGLLAGAFASTAYSWIVFNRQRRVGSTSSSANAIPFGEEL